MTIFRVTKILDTLIEVEQTATGHRMTFCLVDDSSDLARGSFHENPAWGGGLTKDCWRGAYLQAKRTAIVTGLIRPPMAEPATFDL